MKLGSTGIRTGTMTKKLRTRTASCRLILDDETTRKSNGALSLLFPYHQDPYDNSRPGQGTGRHSVSPGILFGGYRGLSYRKVKAAGVWNLPFTSIFLFNMCMYSYCYICSVYSVSLCCSVYCFFVNVYCTTATGCQPIAVNKIYHTRISYLV